MFVSITQHVISYCKSLTNRIRSSLDVRLAALLATSLCMLISACSDDSHAPAASSSHTQNNATSQAFTSPTPAQTPPGVSAEAGAATTQHLAIPVIHTVD